MIVFTFYSPSCLGQETAKEPFGLRGKLPPALLSTTHGGDFMFSFLMLKSSREALSNNFYCLWFDPTENQTQVFRFRNRRSIQITTDRFKCPENHFCFRQPSYHTRKGGTLNPHHLRLSDELIAPPTQCTGMAE